MSEREQMTLKLVAYHNEQARGASFEWHARCATHVENQEQIIKALADALEAAKCAMWRGEFGDKGRDKGVPEQVDAALRLAGRL